MYAAASAHAHVCVCAVYGMYVLYVLCVLYAMYGMSVGLPGGACVCVYVCVGVRAACGPAAGGAPT
jgi:hypothetical protein